MGKAKIDQKEYFTLFTLFILGNDLITGMVLSDLRQNSWIALSISLLLFMFFFTMYYKTTSNMNYIGPADIIKKLFGKSISKIILIIYAVYFFFMGVFLLSDILEIIQTYLIPLAPKIILGALLMLVVFYVLLSSIEVLARMSQLLFFMMFFSFIAFSIIILSFNDVSYLNILPILEDGLKPMFKEIAIMSYGVPFGGAFVLLFVIKHVNNKKNILRLSLFSITLGGLIIILITIFNILILGPKVTTYSLTPLLLISKKLDIENIIQRFDLLTIVILLYVVFIRISIFVYGTKECIYQVFKFNKKMILFFITLALLLVTHYFFIDYITFLNYRISFIIPYILSVFEVFIPFILFIMSLSFKPKDVS